MQEKSVIIQLSGLLQQQQQRNQRRIKTGTVPFSPYSARAAFRTNSVGRDTPSDTLSFVDKYDIMAVQARDAMQDISCSFRSSFATVDWRDNGGKLVG